MEVRYFKEWSRELDRDMEFKVYGSRGKLCFAFPPQNGRFWDFENFGMVECMRPWIEEGRIMLVCADGIDGESWSAKNDDPRHRIEMQEKWFRYITLELYPRARELGDVHGKGMLTGCSMGAVHSGIFFFRRPDLFDTVVALSGTYNANDFIPGYMDDLIYDNSPVYFLPNMPFDHPYMELYRQSQLIFCVGQGAWEDELLAGTRALDAICREKAIPAWFDYWGFDVNHDWCWWQKQLPYFMGKLDL